MINLNGNLIPDNNTDFSQNRGFHYGDAVFETVKVLNGKVLFLEDHYFRLMAAMRIIRMRIPMDFTMEYFEDQLLQVTEALKISDSARVRMTVFRNEGGYYLPETNQVSFVVSTTALKNKLYELNTGVYEVDLFKDFYITKQLLSSIKSTNRLVNITGSIYASENGLQNCLLLNDTKNVVEALQGNLFMYHEGVLMTPPVSEGCVNGVMRKQLIRLLKDQTEVREEPISPFDLQKADELFITNVISGVTSVTQYRKKQYDSSFAANLVTKLNESISAG